MKYVLKTIYDIEIDMKNLIKLLFIIPAFLMFNCGGSDDDNLQAQ